MKYVHKLADISQASSAFRVFLSTVTFSRFILKDNFLKDSGFSLVFKKIPFNVSAGVFKTVADKVFH